MFKTYENFLLYFIAINTFIMWGIFHISIDPHLTSYHSAGDIRAVAESISVGRYQILIDRNDSQLSTEWKYGATRIPNIVHFVFGMDKSAVFGLVQYLAVASASTVLRPKIIYIHCLYSPRGFFWDLVSSVVEVRRVRDTESIFGNPVTHYAHKADIARLRALLEFGGIYLDLDIISLAPFDHLLNNSIVMGQEGVNGKEGLCNAVIIAAKDSKLLRIWYDSYVSFNASHWNYHSVVLPKKLAVLHPKEITILSHRSFFWPMWDPNSLDSIYSAYTYDYKDNLAVHLWDSIASKSVSRGFSMIWLLQNRSSLLSKLDVYLPTPIFSVIITCYSQRNHIGNAINSVTEQSWPLWEIIVVDDGSEDGCGQYVSEHIAPSLNRDGHRPCIKVISLAQRLGVAQAQNVGIASATGFWVCMLSADDRIERDYFSNAEKAITADPTLNMIYINQNASGGSRWALEAPDFDSSQSSPKIPVAYLYRRNLWQQVNGYSSALPSRNEDYDFWMKLVEFGAHSCSLNGPSNLESHGLRRVAPSGAGSAQPLSLSSMERAMLLTRYLSLYSVKSIFDAHRTLELMPLSTYEFLQNKLLSKQLSRSDAAYQNFWLGLQQQHVGNQSAAISSFTSAIAANVASMRWQPLWHLALSLCKVDSAQSRLLIARVVTEYPELRVYQDLERGIGHCVE
jgi:glycosyltransferase involved in cell wall biosynthesis